MTTEFARSQTLDYHVWDMMLGCYQKYTPKPSNIAELKTALLSIWIGTMCHRSSLIRQSRHFERDFDRVLLQLVDIFNTQFNSERDS